MSGFLNIYIFQFSKMHNFTALLRLVSELITLLKPTSGIIPKLKSVIHVYDHRVFHIHNPLSPCQDVFLKITLNYADEKE